MENIYFRANALNGSILRQLIIFYNVEGFMKISIVMADMNL